ncbi:hypothetical protein SteCoe_22614 [Stentor coeruleus]|uniref:Uncharacterized protein n=1 Tax=Stentor coeruleus TaxID=5963 RepID=A0A1R2BLT5_9CILI|nr:hypothetical protein SteCoe_22614 [Stentor coeruleus]
MDSIIFKTQTAETQHLISERKIRSMSGYENLHGHLKYLYLSSRPKNVFGAQPSNKVISNRPSTGANLGPGKYNVVRHSPTPSFEFSKTPRFCLDNDFPIKTIFHRITDKEKQEILNRIEKNKGLAAIPPNIKYKLEKEKAHKKKVRATVTKITQQQIYLEQKHKKQEILKDKFRKFNYRMNMPEVLKIRISWILLNIGIGTVTVLRTLIKNRKKLRARSIKLLLWFKQVCTCIGKIVILRKKMKYLKAVRKIRINLIPVIHLWVKQKRKRYKKTIIYIVEKKLSSSQLTNLIIQWRAKLIFIQKMMKNALFFKLSLYESLLFRWNQAEYNLLEDPHEPKHRRRKTVNIRYAKSKTLSEGFSTIPIEIKMYHIRKTIREIMTKYFNDLRHYRIQFNNIKRTNKKNRWILNKDIISDYPVRPEKPNLYKSFTADKLISLINAALQDRSNWSVVLQNQQKIFSRSYRPRSRLL